MTALIETVGAVGVGSSAVLGVISKWNSRTDGFNNLYGLATCILAGFVGFSLLLLVCCKYDSMLGRLGTNSCALDDGATNNQTADARKKNAGAGIEQLKTNLICVNAQAGLAGDAKNEKLIAEINNPSTGDNTSNLECVVQDQHEIRVCLTIHIVNDAMTPNISELSHARPNDIQPR